MLSDDFFKEGDPVPEEEPVSWHPPVRCPSCGGVQTRFITLRYEMSVYECEVCGTEFETEEEN